LFCVFAISMGQLLGVEKILNKLWIHVGLVVDWLLIE
jgi:hypothetical protein